MSVRTGFAIVGTVIGAYFGNAQLGYAIGSVVGGMVDPVRSFGPKIDDAKTQTAQTGAPISLVWGAARVAGNIIASGPLKQHKHTDNGKSGQEAITYTYTRTYAIAVCAGPIQSIRRVWRDNKLVYDATPDREQKTRLANRQFANKFKVYLGDETQMPNAELQAILGADNVPAFRGLAYFVVTDDDLTDRGGSIPAYQVEVVTEGSSVTNAELKPMLLKNNLNWLPGAQGTTDPRLPGNVYQYRFRADGVTGGWKNTPAGALTDYTTWSGGREVEIKVSPVGWGQTSLQTGGITPGWQRDQPMSPFEDPGPPDFTVSLIFQRAGQGGGDPLVSVSYLDTASSYSAGKWGRAIRYLIAKDTTYSYMFGSGVVIDGRLRTDFDTRLDTNVEPYLDPNIVQLGDAWVEAQAVPSCLVGTPESDWVLIPGTDNVYVDRLGNVHDLSSCTPVSGSFLQLAVHTPSQVPLGPLLTLDDPRNNATFWQTAYDLAVAQGNMPSGLSYGTNYPRAVSEACYCQNDTETDSDGVPLYVIVSDLLNKVGIADEQMDVSQLTDIVDGYVVSSQSTAADAVNTILPAYQAVAAEWDGKLRFVKFGLPTIAALIDVESVESDDGQLVLETRAQEVTVPRKLILTYQDQSSNYAPVTQEAERYRVTVDAVGESSISTPVVMNADKAAQFADILLKDNWSALRGTLKQKLADEFSYLTPTDVIYVTSGEALFRARIESVTIGDGTFAYEAVQDLESAYSSSNTGVQPLPPADGPVNPIGPTLAYYLNIPALRDKDDQPGFYVAASGFFDGWNGALIEYSIDGGLNWIGTLEVRQESSLGVTLTSLAGWSPLVPDEDNTVDVYMTSGELSSITQSALDNGGNAAWIDGEVIQFKTATLIEESTYRLSGLVRGRKYTPTVAHAANSSFAMLDSVYFIPVNRSQIGATFTMRATTSGASTADGDVRSLTLNPARSVTEWPVTNVRSYRDEDHTAHLEWTPRHRLGTPLYPYASLYFTGYRIAISNGATEKIYDTTAQSFEYTDTMATADFGSTGPFTFTIYAMNNVTGQSDPTEVML